MKGLYELGYRWNEGRLVVLRAAFTRPIFLWSVLGYEVACKSSRGSNSRTSNRGAAVEIHGTHGHQSSLRHPKPHHAKVTSNSRAFSRAYVIRAAAFSVHVRDGVV
jgi:hypothetical protein